MSFDELLEICPANKRSGELCPNWRDIEAAGHTVADFSCAVDEGVAAGRCERRFGGMWAGESVVVI